MSILGTKDYLIHAHFVVRSDEGIDHKPTYVGNFETLRRTIATSYSKIPHDVKVEGNSVFVSREGTKELLAKFDFEELHRQEIPDHF